MRQGAVFLILILHLFLHGLRKTVFISNVDPFLHELMNYHTTISLMVHIYLLDRTGKVFGKNVNTTYTINVLDYDYNKGILYIIVSIFHMVLKFNTMFLTHALT